MLLIKAFLIQHQQIKSTHFFYGWAMINRIQNKSLCSHNICVCSVYN